MILTLAAATAVLMSALLAVSPAMVAAFTAGDNGHPTNGPYSDLKGGTGTFTFEQNGVLFCSANDSASSFSFKLDYANADLPAGASIVVYLSPNQGAINNNGGSDPNGYIAAVEANYGVINFPTGLSGNGTLDIDVDVTTAFTATGGGILGVVAAQTSGSVTTSKTNSLNCTESQSTPTPTPTATPTATPTPEGSVGAATGSPGGSVEAATGSPQASTPNTAFAIDGQGPATPLMSIFFAFVMLSGLGTLAIVNVKAARRR